MELSFKDNIPVGGHCYIPYKIDICLADSELNTTDLE